MVERTMCAKLKAHDYQLMCKVWWHGHKWLPVGLTHLAQIMFLQ